MTVPSQARRSSTPSSIKVLTSATPTSAGCSVLGSTSPRTHQKATSTFTGSEEERAARCTKTAPATSATGASYLRRSETDRSVQPSLKWCSRSLSSVSSLCYNAGLTILILVVKTNGNKITIIKWLLPWSRVSISLDSSIILWDYRLN